MIVFAVIDTNVLVSSLLSSHPDAATVQIVNKLFSGDIVPLYTEDILKEYHDVLNRPKFHFSPPQISNLLESLIRFGILVKPQPSDLTLTDAKDLPFYEAISNKHKENAYLITGNIKHFPFEPFIVTPTQMLDILSHTN